MKYCVIGSLAALLSAGSLTLAPAASPMIGVAVAEGSFRVNGHVVTGNATLFDGNTIETGGVPSELQLDGGVRMLLAAGSRGKVYRDRVVLEKGLGELANGPDYPIEARGLRIVPGVAEASGRVALGGGREVLVAALAGTFRVTTAEGRMVAIVRPGMTLAFQAQAAGQPEFSMSGCLERRGGQYVLRDLIAGIVEELRGDRLDQYVGNVVEVTAVELPNVKPVTGAEEVIQIKRIRRISGSCPAPSPGAKPAAQPGPRAPTPSGPPAQAPKAGGMSGATKAVIAGVIIGGAGAGAAVALTRKSEDKGTISR